MQKFVYGIQSHYPHMAPADVHLWEKFIRAQPGAFEFCTYDVPVGEAPAWLDVENDPEAAKQAILYKKKIDVVAEINGTTYIIEVKPFAGSKALGQLMSYELLYKDQHPETERIVKTIITNQCQNGYAEIFMRHGIHPIEVGVCPRCKHYPSL